MCISYRLDDSFVVKKHNAVCCRYWIHIYVKTSSRTIVKLADIRYKFEIGKMIKKQIDT